MGQNKLSENNLDFYFDYTKKEISVDCSCNLIIDRMLYLLNSRPVIRLHISYVIIRVLLPLLITFSIFFLFVLSMIVKSKWWLINRLWAQVTI